MYWVHSLRTARNVLPVNPRLMTVPSSAGTQQRVLVSGDGARFGRRDESGTDPHAIGAEGQRRREAPPVESRPRRRPEHTVDDLRDERHRRDRAGVATGFGALRDHEVAAGLDRGDRVTHLAAHARDDHTPRR